VVAEIEAGDPFPFAHNGGTNMNVSSDTSIGFGQHLPFVLLLVNQTKTQTNFVTIFAIVVRRMLARLNRLTSRDTSGDARVPAPLVGSTSSSGSQPAEPLR
jgi:hypothetical protein